MADIKQYQVTGWNAAAIASHESLEAAKLIIEMMSLDETHCDESDWETLVEKFGGLESLLKGIYQND